MNRVALLYALLFSSAASAADFEFGRQGQVIPSGSIGVSYSKTGANSSFFATISPSIAYFVADHIALGLSMRYSVQKLTVNGTDQGTLTSAGFSPYGGIDFPISPSMSFFPQAGVDVLSSSTGQRSLAINAFAPVLFHPASHLFLGFGPGLFAEILASFPSTSVGGVQVVQDASRTFAIFASSVIGGYF
jgi:hypothetical protein